MDGCLDGFAVSHYYIYQAGPFKKKQSVPAAAFPYSSSKQGEEIQHTGGRDTTLALAGEEREYSKCKCCASSPCTSLLVINTDCNVLYLLQVTTDRLPGFTCGEHKDFFF